MSTDRTGRQAAVSATDRQAATESAASAPTRDRPQRAGDGGGAVSAGVGIAAQRRRFGGLKWGAAFFGWLVATGLAVIATAIISAAGVALALNTISKAGAKGNAATIGVAGGAVLVVILVVAYYAGGYVAGRLARFDGALQGVGVWLIGIVVTVAFAVAGAIAGSQYNILNRLNLPNLPVGTSAATTGGVIALVVAVLATLVAAVLGGKVGEHYHRKIDRVGTHAEDPTPMAR
jgi:hypothetical protein